METILLIAICVIFFAYVIYTRITLGQTDSISRTVIWLEPKYKWMFTLMSWIGFIFPFIDPGLIPAGFSLVAMGATIHWNKYGTTLHNVTATATYSFALLFLAIKFWFVGIIYTGIMAIAIIFMKYFWIHKQKEYGDKLNGGYVNEKGVFIPNFRKVVVYQKWVFKGEIPNYTYWLEIVGFVIIVIGLFIHCQH